MFHSAPVSAEGELAFLMKLKNCRIAKTAPRAGVIYQVQMDRVLDALAPSETRAATAAAYYEWCHRNGVRVVDYHGIQKTHEAASL